MPEQYDTAYFNGEEVGHSGDEPPLFYLAARLVRCAWLISARQGRQKRDRAADRVLGQPAVRPVGTRRQRRLRLADTPQNRRQSVATTDRKQLFAPLPAEALQNRPRPNDAAIYNTPTILYNAMIHPLIPYPIRGVVWYQGESNASRPALYSRLFPLLIEDWRRPWGQGDFPFYFVQLASYLPAPKDPNEESPWARLREAQASVLGKVPHTGMAVTIDIGEGDNIHPINKQDVGRRLALAALAETYGRSIEFAVGPTYAGMSVEGDQHPRAISRTPPDCAPRGARAAGLPWLARTANSIGPRPASTAIALSSHPRTLRARSRCAMPGRTIPKARTCSTPPACRPLHSAVTTGNLALGSSDSMARRRNLKRPRAYADLRGSA